ncbi:hypothetical protein LTR56_015985 [Elasticomyces elasticus]|nr:hypothetical protein LTR22_021240 [Elasticomyces elasticus]KAK3633071.1 hypothetical protein LTR56_015985 [Elasticomyces elasticus]KAK4917937.1 hypothetical protein LTR49_014212 [Elasticomyces elasticus]KAK5753334.1 hypothetical protein LTS12_016577 [Elasticomyces elasticus]
MAHHQIAESEPVKPYKYADLERDGLIRLLKLLPREGGPLVCELLVVDLLHSPDFEALSYTWGEPTFPNLLEVDNHCGYLKITDNLRDALEALRNTDGSRFLWVDAVCINQQDPEEKGRQVGMMKDIYQAASRVVVWLGKEHQDPGMAEVERRGFAILEDIGRNCNSYGFDKIFPPFPRTVRDDDALAQLKKLARECDFIDVAAVYQHAWYERVWIVQEFVLAKAVELRCGSFSVSYDHFSKATAVFILMLRRRTVAQEMRHNRTGFAIALWEPGYIRAWSMIQQRERYLGMPLTQYNKGEEQRSLYAHEDQSIRPSSLIEYCHLGADFKCFDERDRVYGMLGFAYGGLDITPDYHASPESVWEMLATRTLLSGDLTVLHYAGISANEKTKVRSFAADFGHWTQKMERLGGHGHPRYHAATQIPARVELEPDGSVRVHAIKIDTVNRVCQNEISEETSAETTTSQTEPSMLAARVRDADDDETWATLSSADLPRLLRGMYAWWMSFLHVEGQRYYGEEKGELAFPRTIIAGMALPFTKNLCGNLSPDTLDLMFVLCMLVTEETDSLGQKMEVVNTWEVYKWMKRPLAVALAPFLGDPDPSIYYFPQLCGEEFVDRMWHQTLYETGYHDLQASDEELRRLGLVQGLPPGRIMEITSPLKEQLENYRIAVSSILSERRLFFTNVRLLGLGPKEMRPGDVVMVPEGAQTPFLYRPVSRPLSQPHVRKGRLVGECYVDGLMDGDPKETLDENYQESHIEVILI